MRGQPSDSKELRCLLRNAMALLAASDVESPQRLLVAQRARDYLTDALCGLDRMLRDLAEPVPSLISDAATEPHTAIEIELPILRLPRGGRR